jgi:hypothetical protein
MFTAPPTLSPLAPHPIPQPGLGWLQSLTLSGAHLALTTLLTLFGSPLIIPATILSVMTRWLLLGGPQWPQLGGLWASGGSGSPLGGAASSASGAGGLAGGPVAALMFLFLFAAAVAGRRLRAGETLPAPAPFLSHTERPG